MKNAFQVRVGRRGTITIPQELRKRNAIAESDFLTLTNLGNGVLVLSRHHSQVNTTADKLALEWKQAGTSLPSMLKTLRHIRKENSQGTL